MKLRYVFRGSVPRGLEVGAFQTRTSIVHWTCALHHNCLVTWVCDRYCKFSASLYIWSDHFHLLKKLRVRHRKSYNGWSLLVYPLSLSLFRQRDGEPWLWSDKGGAARNRNCAIKSLRAWHWGWRGIRSCTKFSVSEKYIQAPPIAFLALL